MSDPYRMRCLTRKLVFPVVAALTAAPLARGLSDARRHSWQETLLSCRETMRDSRAEGKARTEARAKLWQQLERDFPIQCDWLLQDLTGEYWRALDGGKEAEALRAAAEHALAEIGDEAGGLKREWGMLPRPGEGDGPGAQLLDLYVRLCERRRTLRLQPLLARAPQVVFTKHFTLGGSHYAYTEGQSDAQKERHFQPGTALCVLELEGTRAKVRTLISDPKGVIRDPDVSLDGRRILFSWKKSDREDDYHLYEWNTGQGEARQLTSGLGVADYEGQYLPSGDIIFNSTRCVQIVDCWWTEVSNLYTCGRDGRHIRRLSFDQVHTNYPTVTDDGRVLYTRWEYNDRGQLYPQPLCQMNPDGTGQTEFYGNNSWFPTTILHARGIPGTQKVLAIATGHHTLQAGKLIVIDRRHGQQEAQGVTLVAPVRETKAVRVDRYGQDGELFQYPYPLSETEYLVTYDPYGWSRRPTLFGIYFMTLDGRRELLVSDPDLSCSQPVPLTPRPAPHRRPALPDYSKNTGTYFVQDVYSGPGLEGVARGTVKRLRVVALEYRAAGIGSNRNGGPAGGALVSTPISIDNGSWDVKVVLGDARVYDDGSACFTAPARTPVYFQLLDARGHAVQTMRSWSTLQPGEAFSCVGCHEPKDATPMPSRRPPQALAAGPQVLSPFRPEPRGFSFPREVQPILDRHCIRCHRRPQASADLKPTASHTCPSDSEAALCDQLEPRNSDDHGIPRFTWWSHKGTREWAEYEFRHPVTVRGVRVYWFDDRPRGGGCRVPQSWSLLYRTEGSSEWREVAAAREYGVAADTYNDVQFESVQVTALRLDVQLQAKFSSGVLEWQVLRDGEKASGEARPKPAFSLLGTPVKSSCGRLWSESYLRLTARGRPNRLVDWISAQSVPPMLPPYHKGAAKSELMKILTEGHSDVKLSQPELETIACWIDLLVPFCGDYAEANCWSEGDQEKHAHFLAKRRRFEALERQSIKAFLAGR